VEILRSRGFKVSSPEDRLKDIALNSGATPARVYGILALSGEAVPLKIGRLSLRRVCLLLDISVNECLDRLRRRGVIASPDETLREVAAGCGRSPRQILDILRE
jgi:hypothetical protein